MKIFLLLLFIAPSAFALEAVVTVLETPMLKSPSLDAPVVQYLRKGDVIELHPVMDNTDRYDHLAPLADKQKKIREELEKTPEWNQDEVFTGKTIKANAESEFIPMLDRLGNTVFVMRDHLYIYFETEKELTQTVLTKDPTDYRLEEPLPKNYPFYHPTGYRGQVTLGVTQPYFESYPYQSQIKTKGYMSPIDFNVALLRITKNDKQDRFYFGGNFNVRVFSNEYLFVNERTSSEKGLRLGLGPYITYDAYKAEKNRVNLYGSINFNFFNQLIIAQSDQIGSSDERIYRAYSFATRIGAQYHRKQVMEDVDFVIGTAMEVEPATTFRAKNAATQVSWWADGGNDKFSTRTTFTLAAYLGFQSAY
jgi:hypothetical protein